MKMSVRIEGFDKVKRSLEQLRKNAQRLHGTHQIPAAELFHEGFMRSRTRFGSFEAMLTSANISTDEFLAMSDSAKDDLVRGSTTFGSWEEMTSAASAEWAQKQLFK